MRNQLRLLSNQAKEYGMDKTSSYGGYEPISFMDYYTEKLAELIAYECIDLALGSSHREDDMGAIIANKIKKHFGVTE